MLRLDYISCALTVVSTVLIGRRAWHGWIVAGVNSVLLCVIGARTAQLGFIPANVFCLGIYGYNLIKWRERDQEASRSADALPPGSTTAVQGHASRKSLRVRGRAATDEQSLQQCDPIFPRRLRRPGKSRTSL